MGRLAQGNDVGVSSADTIEFFSFTLIPNNNKITYVAFAYNHRHLKEEPWRMKLVVGGDKLIYNDDTSSPPTDMLETKLLFNSIISDTHKGARFAAFDLKDMFLMTLMDRPEYMRVPFEYFPEDVR